MGTICDYIKGESEALTADNYNEIDALVFAELSYFRFEDNGYTGNAQISVADYANKIKENPDAYKQGGEPFSDDKIAFIEALANSERYRDCTMCNFATPDSLSVNGENLKSQWAAYTVEIGDGTSVVAMRGTDGTTIGWTEDLQLLYDADGTNAQILSAEYLKSVNGDQIYLTGHSKGGNDVIAAYMMSDADVRDNVLRIDNYDGPGVNSGFQNNYAEGYAELGDKLNNYCPQDSVIGRFLIDNPGNIICVESEVRSAFADKGILGEHDPYSFVIGNDSSFERGKLSYLSELINTSLDQTVASLSQEERENMIAMICKLGVASLIANDGNDPYADNQDAIRKALDEIDKFGLLSEEIKSNMTNQMLGLVNVYEALCIYKNSSEEEKKALKDVLGLVVSNAYHKVTEDAYNAIKNAVEAKIQKIYNNVVGKLVGVRDWAVEALAEIKDGVMEKFEAISDAVENYMENWGKNLSNFIQSFSGDGKWEINIAALHDEVAHLKAVSAELGNLCQRISAVKSELGKSTYGAAYLPLKALEEKVERESRDCERLKQTLEAILKIHLVTEKKICTQ